MAVNDVGDTLEHTRKLVDIGNSSAMEAVVGRLDSDRVYQFEMWAYTRKDDGQHTRQRRVKTHGAGK